MEWSDIKALVAVGVHGSLAAGARALGVSNAKLSRRIDQLEHRLDVQLFNRTPAGMALTEEGQAAFTHAVTMERAAAQLEDDLAVRNKGIDGLVRVHTHDGVASYILAPRLPGFQRAHPGLRIDLQVSDEPAGSMPGGADIVLQFDEDKSMGHVAQEVATIHYALFSTRSYMDLYGDVTSVGEGVRHKALTHSGYSRQAEQWDEKLAPIQQFVDFVFETNCTPALHLAIANGGGVGLLPTYFAAIDPRLILVDGPVASLSLWVVFAERTRSLNRVRHALEWVRATLDSAEQPWFRPEFIHPSEFSDVQCAALR